MKNAHKINLIHFLSALSFSSLLLTVSALTDSRDVEAIGLLLTTFPLLARFPTGDPCLPNPYLWVNCSSDFTPRVTALNLQDHFLVVDGRSRTLPDFSAMDALEIIDLSYNWLHGEFPDFLANFPRLKVLNLRSNYLTGTVPTSLRDKSKANMLKLMLDGIGTPCFCYSDEASCSTESRSKTLPIALGVGIPVFVIFLAMVLILAIDQRKKKAAAAAAAAAAAPTTGPKIEISGLAVPVKA